MRLIKAQASDGDQLSQFLKSTKLPGLIDISIDRENDFFQHYKLLSDDYVTFTLVDDNNEPKAMATLIFKEAMIEGKKQLIGYATDLRVSPTREAILHWAEKMLPAMIEERDKRHCDYIFSAVAKSYTQIYNAFIRPKTNKRALPRYYLYRKFKVINIHGILPLAKKPIDTLHIAPAKIQDLASINDYIQSKLKERPFHFCVQSIEEILKLWPNMGIENFILAKDYEHNIVGVTNIWDPSEVQKMRPSNFSKRAITLQETLRFLRLFGWTRPIVSKDQALNMKQLNFTYVNNPDIFQALLYYCYKHASAKKYLSYIHFKGELDTLPLRSMIASSVPFGLYCIVAPGDHVANFLKPSFETPPLNFDIAYV